MSGIQLRIEKMFKKRKNLIISALDHVMEYGDQPGIEDARNTIKNCLAADALLIPRFMLKRNWDLFCSVKNPPVPIVRINWSSAFYYPLDYREGNTAIATTVEEAVEAGAEAVICSLFLEEGDELRETKNVSIFSEVVRQKEALGIPLIGEAYIIEHKDKSKNEIHLKVKRVSRIMAELGADLIKTFYTGEKFNEVIQNTPVPVFTIGADRLNSILDVIKKASYSIEQGARGIIFGRNIFMAKDPEKVISAIDEVINQKKKPEDVLIKYNIK